MMKTRYYAWVGLALVLSAAATLNAQRHELKTNTAVLVLDRGADTFEISSVDKGRQVSGRLSQWWQVVLKNKQTKKKAEAKTARTLQVEQGAGVLRLVSGDFVAGDSSVPVKAEWSIAVEGDAFCFSGTVASASEDWEIEEAACMKNTFIQFAGKGPSVYWPHELGLRFDTPKQFGSREFDYPGPKGVMAWFSLNDEKSGMYIGSHDPLRGAKNFSLAYVPAKKGFVFNVKAPVCDKVYVLPKTVVKFYDGTWHEGARTYRGWYDSIFKRAKAPEWLRNNEGFILAIFKQQNGSLMWEYKDLDRLCDIGEKMNFKLLGVWGWGVGGHDRLYPSYTPDNLMGGRLELKKAIARAQKRGFKVIVYSNGTLIDSATDYYTHNGIDTVLVDSTLRPVLDFYVKHNNSTPVIFTRACPGSSMWRDTMMRLMLSARELGVDAYYIDQVGVRGPDLCYSERHDHRLPHESHTKYRVSMMKELRDKMRSIDPEFCLMTEGTLDALLEDVDSFHSLWGRGPTVPTVRVGSFTRHQFPEMYRYTFPETVIIYLNPYPVLPRWDANYSTLYGLRHEIMSRYPADAELLKSGKAPKAEDYSTIYRPPDVGLINEVPLDEAMGYVNRLTKWETENADLLRTGNFIDDEGIKVSGAEIIAKGFVSDAKLGVVVWNTDMKEAHDFKADVAGYRLVTASEPGKANVSPFAPLAPNSLRLLRYEKKR